LRASTARHTLLRRSLRYDLHPRRRVTLGTRCRRAAGLRLERADWFTRLGLPLTSGFVGSSFLISSIVVSLIRSRFFSCLRWLRALRESTRRYYCDRGDGDDQNGFKSHGRPPPFRTEVSGYPPETSRVPTPPNERRPCLSAMSHLSHRQVARPHYAPPISSEPERSQVSQSSTLAIGADDGSACAYLLWRAGVLRVNPTGSKNAEC
jgi:hypothetical protein